MTVAADATDFCLGAAPRAKRARHVVERPLALSYLGRSRPAGVSAGVVFKGSVAPCPQLRHQVWQLMEALSAAHTNSLPNRHR